MTKLFISHSSQDDAFVRELRAALADQGHDGWIDSRELRGGDLLWPEIQQAIDEASGYAVVVTTDALQSKWVGKELRHALDLRKTRGKDTFPVIPLSLNGTKLGVLEEFFGEEPVYISVSSGAGGVEAAMNAILIAMGKRLPVDAPAMQQPKAEPLEELVLELSDLKFQEQDGKRRASARARLIYQPAASGKREVNSAQSWRLVAPHGPIEAEDLRWYLEKYAIWPSHFFRDRAKKVEADLVKWGRELHAAAMPPAHTANVMQAWAKIDAHAGRRFSVYVDFALEAGTPDADIQLAKEAATELLKTPWELLHHDGDSYLFQGAKPTRVRRRLPNTKVLDVPVVAPPIRILLVTARPEDESCGYIDHRASALPLVEAMEALPGLVKIHVLSPPTLPALRDELDRALAANKLYHVVHFDGHGAYDKTVGLGGLCFELPADENKLEQRRHAMVYTQDSVEHGTGLASLLRDHRIPLVFLEACQTATAEKASESVASELLKVGVASVVAMSHSVLVETAKRFVATFYTALAQGKRVGDAMLAGQRALKDHPTRGHVFGEGELRLEDWFVPVLFQEKDDPQLFKTTPAKQTLADFKVALAARLGDVPKEPETTFIGRSRELLALERLLRRERYAVVRGQGGEGKTALAAEFARWMVRSHQMQRAAFVSVETHGHAAAVLDTFGHQLVGKDYSVATFADLDKATLPIERALTEQATLLVVDNMESILLPPFIAEATPEALSEDASRELDTILKLCARLNAIGDTRLVFTTRETLPAPFDVARHQRELHQLDRMDAVKLVERTLNADGGGGGASRDAATEEIEQLVDAVHGHARTLALLAPALRKDGVERTRQSLDELMAQMEKDFPNSREKSLFASVELSLRRMSDANRNRVRVLGVFHGSVHLTMLVNMMKFAEEDIAEPEMRWEERDVDSLATELVQTGLATPSYHEHFTHHLTLNPALCPYLRAQLTDEARIELTACWVDAMVLFVEFLCESKARTPRLARQLTGLELTNFFALLNLVRIEGHSEFTFNLSQSLCRLLSAIERPQLLERVTLVRDAALTKMGQAAEVLPNEAWNELKFIAMSNSVQQQLANQRPSEACEGAQQLLSHAQAAGEQAYVGAGYHLAMAHGLLAEALKRAGHPERALQLFDYAQQHFQALAKIEANHDLEEMVCACIMGSADCLLLLGRLEESAAACDELIHLATPRQHDSIVGSAKLKLGNVRMRQCRYPEALAALSDACKWFSQLGDSAHMSVALYQIGSICQEEHKPEAAEDAYRQSLAIDVRLGNIVGQGSTLNQLGYLYGQVLNRPEEAAAFYRQALGKAVESGDVAKEGARRTNLSLTLHELRRLDEARHEIRLAIECNTQFGNASQPWKAWAALARIETDDGNIAEAAAAKRQAVTVYLAYRLDGGEHYVGSDRLSFQVAQHLLGGDAAQAASELTRYAAQLKLAHLHPFVHALQAIVAGSRDRSLADAPDLDYTEAAEILFLIETLEKQR